MASEQKMSDPIQALNYDCIVQVLANLPPKDLIRAEGVSKAWREQVRDWMSGLGMRKYFSDALITEKRGEEIDVVGRFKKYVIEGTCAERWAARKANHANEYTVPWERSSRMQGLHTAGDYIAYMQGGQLFGARLGYHEGADGTPTPYPPQVIDLMNFTLDDISDIRVHASGLVMLLMGDYRPWLQMFSIETGQRLWSVAIALHLGRQNYNQVTLGWEKVYQHTRDMSIIDAYDIRMGQLVNSVHTSLKVTATCLPGQAAVVWRIQGREVLVTFDSVARRDEKELYFVDADTGQTLQIIAFKHELLRLAVSDRRDELAFALITTPASEGDEELPMLREIRRFHYQAAEKKFVEQSNAHIDLGYSRLSQNDVFDIDPFRGLIVAMDLDGQFPIVYSLESSSRSNTLTCTPPERFVVESKDTDVSGAVGEGKALKAKRVNIVGNKLFIYYWDWSLPGTTRYGLLDQKVVVLDFGSTGGSPMDLDDATCLHHPSGLAEFR
ncbi:F-box protein [Aspergillus mulundensis]|uniref:F-box domain-containing protein n=1 Tax=Aspergillus mulundensis TaxID=1810919 RepID=A0A3D8T445_9EURO|nr:hypothetical protein DSM5745_00090 [Aspergillus mulundensis]RDW92768.1 hypothetical protein DSM5745_00090 [Aspergillus mulundensis]